MHLCQCLIVQLFTRFLQKSLVIVGLKKAQYTVLNNQNGYIKASKFLCQVRMGQGVPSGTRTQIVGPSSQGPRHSPLQVWDRAKLLWSVVIDAVEGGQGCEQAAPRTLGLRSVEVGHGLCLQGLGSHQVAVGLRLSSFPNFLHLIALLFSTFTFYK